MKTFSHNLLFRAVSTAFILASLIVWVGCESERAKWNFARATHLLKQGETEQAVELMHTALEQAPDDSRIKLSIARILAENGRGEMGVCLCDQHLQNFPNDLAAVKQRAMCRQYIGQFEESLVDYKKSLSDHVGRDINELNALAYFRALANTELTKAAQNIQEAIEKYESKTWGNGLFLTLQIRTTVCAGLISRYTDQREEVLPLLDHKIEQFEAMNFKKQAMIFDRVTKNIRVRFPLPESEENRILNNRLSQKKITDCLAAILATRALINEDLGKTDLADADRQKIKQLGFKFERVVQSLPSDQSSPELMRMGMVYLDTRGFVLGRQPWEKSNSNEPYATSSYYASIEDLDVAVLAAQIWQKALNTALFNTVEIPAHNIKAHKRMANRLTAVLLRHRMEVHERGGRTNLSKQDEQQIEALGLKPDSNLF